MYNQVFLIGRLASMPDFECLNSPVRDALIHLKLERPFDDAVGKREYDLIPVTLWHALATKITDTCHVGSYLAIKGRLLDVQGKPLFGDYQVMIVRAETIELLDHVLAKKED